MILIQNQYGDQLTANINWRIDSIGKSRTPNATKIEGASGELCLERPIDDALDITIIGDAYAATSLLTTTSIDLVRSFVYAGLVRVVDSDTGRYYDGDVVSFAVTNQANLNGKYKSVSFQLHCYSPSSKGASVTDEITFAPSNFPDKMEFESPNPLINLQLGHYNTSTYALISESNSWSWGNSVDLPGFSGTGYLITSTVGNGLEFDCIGGFEIIGHSHATYEHGIAVIIDGVFFENVLYKGAGAYVVLSKKYFSDSKVHRIKVINTKDTLVIDYVTFVNNNPLIYKPQGNCSINPNITILPKLTKRTLTSGGKTAGDLSHNVTIRVGYASNVNSITKSSGAEITTSNYRTAYFCDGTAIAGSASVANNFGYLTVSYNLAASQANFANMTTAEIRSYLKSLTSTMRVYGKGASGGVVAYGAKIYILKNGSWLSYATANWENTDSSLNYIITPITDLEFYLPSASFDGTITFLLVSKYPSDGALSSTIYLDHHRLEILHQMIKIGSNTLVNTYGNLLPNVSESAWYFSPRTQLLSNYEFKLVSDASTPYSSCLVSASGSTTYYAGAKNLSGGTFSVTFYDASSTQISTSNFSANGSFVTPANTHSLLLTYYAPSNSTGRYKIQFPYLLATQLQNFAEQGANIFGLSPAQTLGVTGECSVFSELREVYVNSLDAYQNVNDEFKYESFVLHPGFNQLSANFSGDFCTVILEYTPEWR